ncbi:hypothetical protein S245_035021 [Arachis hypogaea]
MEAAFPSSTLPVYRLFWICFNGSRNMSFGKKKNKTHTLCMRCGRRSFHLQKSRCSACAFPAARKRKYN